MLGYTSGALDSITMHVHTLILKWHRAYLRRKPNKLAIKVENAQGMLNWLDIPKRFPCTLAAISVSSLK
jgi:hypothetical protein